MNIKIKAAGVYCLVGEDYDLVYHTLMKQLGENDLGSLFTERTPGHDYLQWELPGEGWISLTDADPLDAPVVRDALLKQKQAVLQRFGENRTMALNVLSVPDDSFVYFRPREDGRYDIRLTAWGYRYPERVPSIGGDGELKAKTATEPVSVTVINAGRPVPDAQVRLNGRLRPTGPDGILDIGELPVGYQFDIDLDDVHRHVTVTPGEGNIVLDITPPPAPEPIPGSS